jgi:hypothetical protein
MGHGAQNIITAPVDHSGMIVLGVICVLIIICLTMWAGRAE